MTKTKTRTTSKAFKAQIMKHIIDINQVDTLEDIFKMWLRECPPTKRQSYQDAFVSWGQGLPSTISVLFNTEEIIDELEKWFTDADMVFDRKRVEKDPMGYYLNLIYRELLPTGAHLLTTTGSYA